MKRHSGRGSNLALRVVSAAVGIPVVFLLDYLGGLPFGAALALLAAAATLELYAMIQTAGQQPLRVAGTCASAVVAGLPLVMSRPQAAWVGIVALVIVTAGGFYLLPNRFPRGLLGWTLTIVPVVYVGLLLGHMGLLRELHHGARWVAYVLVLTWAYDTGAYAVGSTRGRRPFMRHLSPSKTREGVIGGLASCMAVSLAGIPSLGLALWQVLPLGLVLGVGAQTGDLLESMLKRQTGVKDSGSIVPGHGGLLDRIDSVLFTGTLGYYAALLFGYAS